MIKLISYFGISGSFTELFKSVAGRGSTVPMTKWLSSPRWTSSLLPMTLTFFPKTPLTNESSCPKIKIKSNLIPVYWNTYKPLSVL